MESYGQMPPMSHVVAIIIMVLALSGTAGPPSQLPEGALREARSALMEGRVDEALTELQRLAAQYEDSWFVALWLGHAWHEKGDLPAAANEYLRGLELSPDSPQLLVAIGDVQAETHNLTQADRYFRKAIEVAPKYALAYRKAAAISIELEHHAAAIEFLQRFIELRGEDIEALNVLGIEQFLNEDHDSSIATLDRVLQIDPDNAQAHFGIGMALSDRMTDQERALYHLTRAVELDDSNPAAHYMLGRVLMAQGELESALPQLERAVALSPELADAHYRLAQLYARMGDRNKARESQQQFEELQRSDEEAEFAEKRLGILKTDASKALGRNDLAAYREAMRELTELVPEDPDVRILVVRGALASGDYDSGFETVETLLEERADRWDALYYRGILLQRTGRLEEAKEALQEALKMSPLFEEGYAALGNVLMALDDAEGAVDAYLAAARLDRESPANYLNLATAYGKLGLNEQEAEAMATYRRLLERR
jgi:superkiller protein 3